MNKVFSLFKTFFKIGLFTFGGGYAMLPFIEDEIINKKKWIAHEEVIDIFAIAESTPGVIAINTATFVGYKVAGTVGSIAATIGTFLPSFLIITIITFFIKDFLEIEIISAAFKGISAGVCVLILGAVKKLSKYVKFEIFNIIMFSLSLIVCLFFGINAVYILLSAVAIGIIASAIKAKGGK